MGPGIPDFQYIDYPSFMKEETEKNYTTKFPKITICLNSMHSLEKLLRYRKQPETKPEVISKVTGSDQTFFRFYPRMVNVTSNHRTNKKFIDSKILTVRDPFTRFLSFNHHGTYHSILWPVIKSKNLATWYKF